MKIILKKPVITEKSMQMAASGLYTFLINRKARKPEVEKAVKEMFGVEVVAVKTANFKDEKKSQRAKRGYFVIPGFKKTVVELKKGQKIALFETEETAKKEKGKEEVKEKKSLLKGTKVKIERE
ncbi:MAG: 50S ribosomal protein L23 [Patescibacteria group bacterium]|nr:50S ribosomal protein L23 [Patescibacteria group bacterium]